MDHGTHALTAEAIAEGKLRGHRLVTIHVKDVAINSHRDPLEVNVPAKCSFYSLKCAVAEHWKLPPVCQQISLRGVEVLDSEEIGEQCSAWATDLSVELAASYEELYKALSHEDRNIRLNAVALLGQVVHADESRAKSVILQRLRRLELDGEAFAETLVSFLEDSDARVRATVGRLLGELVHEKSDPVVLKAITSRMSHRDPGVRIGALSALVAVSLKVDAGVAKALCNLLADDVRDVRHTAKELLLAFGAKGSAAVANGLVSLLKHKEPEVRRDAATALGVFARHGDAQITTALSALLGVIKIQVQDAPVEEAEGAQPHQQGTDKPKQSSHTKFVENNSQDPFTGVLVASIAALESIASDYDELAISAFRLCASHQESEVRSAAVRALGHLCPKGDKVTTPLLLKSLHDKCSTVRREAVDSLIHITPQGSQEVLDAIMGCLQGAELGDTKWLSVKVLIHLGRPKDQRIGSALLQCMQDDGPGDSGEMIKAASLEGIVHFMFPQSSFSGGEGGAQRAGASYAQRICAAMLGCLSHHRAAVRRAALMAIMEVAPKGDPTVLAAVEERLKDRDEAVRREAERILIASDASQL